MTTLHDEGFNLHEIERGLRDLESSGGTAALSLKRARIVLAETRQALRQAKVKATFDAPREFTVQMKSAFVDRETDSQQFAYDLADAEVRYTADLVDERSSTRSSLQTRAKLALEAMRLAGFGGAA